MNAKGNQNLKSIEIYYWILNILVHLLNSFNEMQSCTSFRFILFFVGYVVNNVDILYPTTGKISKYFKDYSKEDLKNDFDCIQIFGAQKQNTNLI